MIKRIMFVALFLVSFSLGCLYAEAGIVYVAPGGAGTEDGSTWGNALSTVRGGLGAAASGDEIWVAAGTYMPTSGSDRTISFNLKEGVALYGGFAGTETAREDRVPSANETVLSGDIGIVDYVIDNSYHVVIASGGLTSATVLDGFTIVGGNANASGLNRYGGGLYCNSSSPMVGNCTFSGNSASYDGGGMYNTNSSPTVTDCMFSGNRSMWGGGMHNDNSSPMVTDCTFSSNISNSGGGMNNQDFSFPTLTNCMFLNNSAERGGGMYNQSSSPTVTDCTFLGNSASYDGGGMYSYFSPSLTIRDCTFSGNSADHNGGGMLNWSSSPTVKFCTFSGNSSYDGGGMYNTNSSPTVTDCLFFGNISNFGGAMTNWSSSPTVTDCMFSGNSVKFDGAGMSNWYSSPTVTDCTFSDNSAQIKGGGMYNKTSSPTVTNCTFSGNTASDDGGGMHSYSSSSPTMTNCIVAFNSSGIYQEYGALTITHSCVHNPDGYDYAGISDPTGTNGNISDDPIFVGTGDYHLKPGSPCIDTGDNAAVLETIDFDGNPRITDGDDDGDAVVDMGAYEYLPGYETPMPTITDTPAITPTSTPTRFWDVETDGKIDEKDLLWFVKNYDGRDRDNLFFGFCQHWREN